MKLIRKPEVKRLLPSALLISPVMGEMILNPQTLPTPWPVALLSAIIAFVGIISTNSEIGFFAWSTIILGFFRLLATLIGSWNSLRVHGQSGFQYPELTWVTCLTTVLLIEAVGLEKRWKRLPMSKAEGLLLCFTKLTAGVGYVWNIVALGIYANLNNFSNTAQFITNCTEVPTPSWHTMIKCVPQGDEFSCYLGSKDIWITTLFLRSLGLLSCCVSYSGDTKSVIKSLKKWGSIIIFTLTSFYLISTIAIQYKGLNTTGLEGICDINSELLSSKNGYFFEWFKQNWVALKQIALI